MVSDLRPSLRRVATRDDAAACHRGLRWGVAVSIGGRLSHRQCLCPEFAVSRPCISWDPRRDPYSELTPGRESPSKNEDAGVCARPF